MFTSIQLTWIFFTTFVIVFSCKSACLHELLGLDEVDTLCILKYGFPKISVPGSRTTNILPMLAFYQIDGNSNDRHERKKRWLSPGSRAQATAHRGQMHQSSLQKCRSNEQEPKPTGQLGDPPNYISESTQETWHYAIEHAPTGLLMTAASGSHDHEFLKTTMDVLRMDPNLKERLKKTFRTVKAMT